MVTENIRLLLLLLLNMHIIQNYTLKKNVVKKFLPLVMALLQGTKNLFK